MREGKGEVATKHSYELEKEGRKGKRERGKDERVGGV